MNDERVSSSTQVAWVELEGAHNVRDLGGLPARGAVTRPGVLLRGDAVDALTATDVRLLIEQIGLAQVIDLRTTAERTERSEGALVTAGIDVIELPAFDTEDLVRRRRSRAELLASGMDPIDIMIAGYLEIAVVGAPAFATALQRIVQPGGAPALVHCTAGKDRTGVLVALLLEAAGVDRDAVIGDYAVTNDRMAPIVARLQGAKAFEHLAENLPAFVFEAIPATMAGFLEQLDARFGGATEFLGAHGVAPETLVAWRRLVLA